MAQPDQSTSTISSDLVTRYKALKAEEPRLFARDAAHRLGVSEGELIAARCGSDVVRLDDRWPELITAMPTVGRIMSLTRNDWAVHERKGSFRLSGPARMVESSSAPTLICVSGLMSGAQASKSPTRQPMANAAAFSSSTRREPPSRKSISSLKATNPHGI